MRALLLVLLAGCGGAPVAVHSSDAGLPIPPPIPLAHPFAEVPLDGRDETPPVDETGAHAPALTWGLFADLDGDGSAEVILSRDRPDVQVRPHEPATSRFYRFDGDRLITIASPIQAMVLTAADLDGDGAVDLVDSGSVRFGPTFTRAFILPVQLDVSARLTVGDVDGDGKLDILTRLQGDCGAGPPITILIQDSAGFRDASAALLPAGPPVNLEGGFVGFYGGEKVIGAIGRPCGDASQGVPIWFHQRRMAWESFEIGPRNYSRELIMGAALVDGTLALALWNEHVLVRGGMELATPMRLQPAGSGHPQIPWQALAIDLDGDGRKDIIWSHGADDLLGPIPRAIGPQHVAAWRNGVEGWTEFSRTGLDRGGQWRMLAAGALRGSAAIVVGGFGEPARVYRQQQ